MCFYWHMRNRLYESNHHIKATKEHLEGGSFLKSFAARPYES